MTVEERLRSSFGTLDDYAPSPDLFAKVQRSIEEDAAHRRRFWRIAGWLTAGVAILVAFVLATSRIEDGVVVVPWWTIETVTFVLMGALIVLVAPLIRRFGRSYAADVFRDPNTGRSVLRLLDIAYYLTLGGLALLLFAFVEFTGSVPDGTQAELVTLAVQRLGLLALAAGFLHGVTIVAMPFIGLIFSASRWRLVRETLGDDAPEPDPYAVKADRLAGIVVWIAVIVGAWQAIGFVLLGPLIGLGG